MSKTMQRILLVVGAGALLILMVELTLSIAATMRGPAPTRVVRVNAGPYPLTVSLYADPARAGFALPFAIATKQPQPGPLTLDVISIPGTGVIATPIHAASFTLNPNVRDEVRGSAEITVQGSWNLFVSVDGPLGHGVAAVPVMATAPPAIPLWLGWAIGLIPPVGLLAFLLVQKGHKVKSV